MMSVEELITYIKQSLGSPAITVYVADDSIRASILRSLNKAKPFLNQRVYISGLTTPANLTSLGVKQVTRVFESPATSPSMGSTTGTFDEFSFVNFAAVGSNDISSKLIIRSCFDMLRAEADAVVCKDFRYIDGVLYTDNYRAPITVEAILDYTVSNMHLITHEKIVDFIQEYALASVMEIEGRIRRKFTVSSAPFTMDGDQLVSEGAAMKESLLRDLSENGVGFFTVLR